MSILKAIISGSGGGGGGTPGGSSGQVQYNNAGSFGGLTGLTTAAGALTNIDGAIIGATTPAAGTFTTLNANNGGTFTGSGSATLADASTQPGIFTGGATPTAGNLYGIAIEKTGTEEVFLGINKNSATGSVPANGAYLSTYTTTGTWSIGRGNGAGLPNTADIAITSTGAVVLQNTYSASTGTQQALSIFPTISQTSTAGYMGLYIAAYENTTGSGNKRLIDAGTSTAAGGGGTYTSMLNLTDQGYLTLTQGNSASNSTLLLSGAPYTGGTGTTTLPLFYLNGGATAPTTWSTSGTMFGINAPSGFTGNFLDFHTNGGGSVFNINNAGGVAIGSSLSVGGSLTAPVFQTYSTNTGSNFATASTTSPTAQLNATSVQFAGSTNVQVRSLFAGNFAAALTTGSNYANVIVGVSPIGSATSGTNAWLTNLAVTSIGTITSNGATVQNTSVMYVAANTATIGTNNYTLYIAGGQNKNAGGWAVNRTPETASYTILNTDYIVAFTALTAAVNATLPSSNLLIGQQHIIKDESGSAGTYNITVVGTIDGATNKVINTAYGVLRVYYNGTNWSTW